MKRLSSVFVVVIVAALAVVSCAKKQTPEQVAEKFLKHLAKAEFKEAKELATGDAEKFVGTLEAFSQMANQKEQKEQKEPEIKDMKCEITGDSAVCTYAQDGNPGKLFMKKIDGKWKVSNMPKEMGGEPEIKDDVIEEDTTNVQAQAEQNVKPEEQKK